MLVLAWVALAATGGVSGDVRANLTIDSQGLIVTTGNQSTGCNGAIRWWLVVVVAAG